MMGRTTLREVRETLAAARSGQVKPASASPTVDELESLARLLEAGESEAPAAPIVEILPGKPNQIPGQTGGA